SLHRRRSAGAGVSAEEGHHARGGHEHSRAESADRGEGGIMATPTTTSLRPQPGPQEAFARTPAEIAIFGGAAGGGKSFALLLEPLYHADNPMFRGVIFRRTVPMLRLEGGLWDTSMQIYPYVNATGLSQTLEWRFRSGARMKFAGMEHEADRLGWQG